MTALRGHPQDQAELLRTCAPLAQTAQPLVEMLARRREGSKELRPVACALHALVEVRGGRPAVGGSSSS